ncbi:MAG: hypothetical protein B6U95_04135 [Thermofilum sp. ex4484_82]|nr:MAG: hypothetical protein B6U95_04135 [Thermofilum sp. ex4484_82]OYT38536.1 MAG: hypothetical protein B6U96_04130 [Archaeoglobales archaeon ex4484_92]
MAADILLEIFVLFFLILVAPVLSRFLKLPVIVTEIILGIIVGPNILGILSDTEWLYTMALIGFIYLMFVVGLEVELNLLKANIGKVLMITMGSLLVPFLLGYVVALVYNLPPLFIGVALSTTSMGVILPTIKEFSAGEEFSQVLLGSAILVDIISMFLLAFIIEEEFLTFDKLLLLMIALSGLLLITCMLKRYRKIRKTLRSFIATYHTDVRLSLTLIFGFAILAEFVGVHAILGSFFAGLFISEFEEKVEGLVEKLLSFGYGFFIPVFFITVGIRTVARFLGFEKYESLSMGLAMSARLSLIIAAAELGIAAGIISPEVYSVFVLLAIISVLLSPSLAKMLIGRKTIVVSKETPIP